MVGGFSFRDFMLKAKCKTCGKEFVTYPSWIKLNRKHCSFKCRNQFGKNNNQWQGNNLSYKGVHRWLGRIFGKANKCENPNCLKVSNFFDWSLLKGKQYLRKRDNFWMLCRSCHKIYDHI